MKTIIFLFSLIAFTFDPALCQIQKGNFLIGGNITYQSIDNNRSYSGNYSSDQFSVSPGVGYFLIDRLAAGFRFDLEFIKSKSENVNTKYTSTSISPFVRYYFLPVSNKINFLVDAAYIHFYEKNRFGGVMQPYYERSNGYSISAGPAFFLSDQVALEFTVGWKHISKDDFDKTNTNMINTGFGLQIHLHKSKGRSR